MNTILSEGKGCAARKPQKVQLNTLHTVALDYSTVHPQTYVASPNVPPENIRNKFDKWLSTLRGEPPSPDYSSSSHHNTLPQVTQDVAGDEECPKLSGGLPQLCQ